LYGACTYGALNAGLIDGLLQLSKPVMPPKVYFTLFLFLYGLKMAISTISKHCKAGFLYCVDLGSKWLRRDEEKAVEHLFEKKETISGNDDDDEDDSLPSTAEENEDEYLSSDDEDNYDDEKDEIKPKSFKEITKGLIMRKPRNFDKELNSTF
jgi:hypothetical protein